jgi:prolyl 4-hydroxylase
LSQTLSPQLRDWVAAQAGQGYSVYDIFKAMLGNGWNELAAIGQLELALRDQLVRAHNIVIPSSVPVPKPDLENAPVHLMADGRRIDVLSVISNPHVVVFGNVLSSDECDALIALARPQMQASTTVDMQTGNSIPHAQRTSSGMCFKRGENDLISAFERRLAALVNWPIESGEGLQVLHYLPRAEYRPHYDYFDPKEPGAATLLKNGGQRVGTIITYLSEPEQGGGTTFPDVRFEVAPKRGNAVFFSYDCPHPSTQTLHGGAPVIAGEKWIATKWLRERTYV